MSLVYLKREQYARPIVFNSVVRKKEISGSYKIARNGIVSFVIDNFLPFDAIYGYKFMLGQKKTILE